MTNDVTTLENQLNDFDPQVRAEALKDLKRLVDTGQVQVAAEAPVANMHCHTFYSFNAYGYSPSAIAWIALRRGFEVVGIVDFDVLDAVDEFLDACEFLGVRGSAGIETRVFIPEFADKEINSPGEPGIYYHMGIGFVSSQAPAEGAEVLADLRQRAGQRNLGVMERVNDYLDPVRLDYEADVLPLTPGGNPTERHMVLAYVQKAQRTVDDPAAFWADRLGMTTEDVSALMADTAKFQNHIRAKLMKRGGVGYVQPNPENFPTVTQFHRMIEVSGALPCAAWLDGTTAGEQEMERLLELLMAQGVVALNIVPDRNWNIADPEMRQVKVQHLHDVVHLAETLALPLNVGTEMNAFGQKLVDDFDAAELQPVRQAFLDGAFFIYGHTVLQRALGLGYQSDWAKEHLPARRDRNAFYTRVGKLATPGTAGMQRVARLAPAAPQVILDELS
jgi:hypothetical protein